MLRKWRCYSSCNWYCSVARIMVSWYLLRSSCFVVGNGRSPACLYHIVIVFVCALMSFNEIYLLFGAGFFALFLTYLRSNKQNNLKNFIPLTAMQITTTSLLPATNAKLFWIFLKIGAILYGSGYVLFAFLDFFVLFYFLFFSKVNL